MADTVDQDWIDQTFGKIPGPFGVGLEGYLIARQSMSTLLQEAELDPSTAFVDVVIALSGGSVQAFLVQEQVGVGYYPLGTVLRKPSSVDPGQVLRVPNVAVDPSQDLVVVDLINMAAAVSVVGVGAPIPSQANNGVNPTTFGSQLQQFFNQVGAPLGLAGGVVLAGVVLYVAWQMGLFRHSEGKS